MTLPRKQLICAEATPYYHVTSRCVRRAFLCGQDTYTGRSYEHRKPWLVDKIHQLTQVFSIGVCAYAVMSNHYHLVLKIETEKNKSLSDTEVVERWQKLFSLPLMVARWLKGEALDKAQMLWVETTLAIWRSRLCDISWFMRCLNELIAREANREDKCKGRFWEGRFKSQAILDDTALLACMAYVDLNPVRAGIADDPESSDYTSIQARIQAYREKGEQESASFLLPLQHGKEEHSKKAQGEFDIAISLAQYLALVDWTGRNIVNPGKHVITADVPDSLVQLGLPEDAWLLSVKEFSRCFGSAAGSWEAVSRFSQQTGHNWSQGKLACCRLTCTG